MRKLTKLLLCGLALAMSLQGASAADADGRAERERTSEADKDVDRLTAYVLARVPQLPGNRLAVMPFTYLDGSFSVEGRLVADLLHMELGRSGKVELLDRENLAAIVAEHKLGEMGMLDPGTLPELGRITGVDAFVFGRNVDLGHKLQLTLRVVDRQSKVVAEDTFPMAKRINTPATPLWEDIGRIKQENEETFGIKVWVDETEVTTGDAVVIKFQAERDCYVTLFNMGTSGQIAVLFPNRFYATNFVKGRKEYRIPGEFQNFVIKAQGPTGIEKLKIFATDANVPLLPEQQNVSVFRSLDAGERSVTRDLAVTLTNLDETAWAEGSFEFEVKEKKAEVAGKEEEEGT